MYKKSHWLTRPVTHTLGIKKIEETSYNKQMNLLIIYYMIIVQLMLFYVNNIDQI
ncbi:MAG: hypothetical protein N5831_03690 [Lactobacillus crispatus]|nr:hypothetical protein [Lactobacillus crispatus]